MQVVIVTFSLIVLMCILPFAVWNMIGLMIDLFKWMY